MKQKGMAKIIDCQNTNSSFGVNKIMRLMVNKIYPFERINIYSYKINGWTWHISDIKEIYNNIEIKAPVQFNTTLLDI